jgi:hypothetical protein
LASEMVAIYFAWVVFENVLAIPGRHNLQGVSS